MLNVPLVEMNISRQYHRNVAREITILWARKPSRVIANFACAPCKFVNREIYKIAVKNNTKSIVYGYNIHELVQIAPVISRDETIIPGITRIRDGLWKRLKKVQYSKKG